MNVAEPTLVADRFAPLLDRLLELLRGLSPEQWQLPTICPGWSVHDLALHLLGGDIGVLSRGRDRYTPGGAKIDDWDSLVALINGLNAAWVGAARRISPQLACDLLRFTGAQVAAYYATLVPHALGGPVSWASPEPAPVWLDLAREYTERWHHQQQIRDAVGAPALDEPFFLAPALGAFVHALPQTFRTSEAPAGTTVALVIDGPGGGSWCVRRDPDDWRLYQGAPPNPDAQVTLGQNPAWQLFTRVIAPADARAQATLAGDQQLGLRLLDTIAVIA